MFRVVFFAAFVAVALSDLSWTQDRGIKFSEVGGAELKKAFDEWKTNFGKTYASTAAESKAFITFIDNWQYIVNFNENPLDTIVLGMNQFSDLNPTQFRLHVHGHTGSCLRQSVGGAFKEPRHYKPHLLGTEANPTSVDWTTKGVVTPVKNQQQCGSCWAFSTTGSLECRTAIKTGKSPVPLSEQQLVDCSKAEGNNGCSGGLMDNAFKYIEKEGGLCSESDYPYTAKDGRCKAASCGTKLDPISSYTDVPHNSASSLETAVAAGCVSVAIEADQQAFQFYKTGIMSGRCGTRLDHGVLVVGYGSEGGTKFWKVKNSWGKTWGEAGYIRMCKQCGKNIGRGECGILEEPSYPLPK